MGKGLPGFVEVTKGHHLRDGRSPHKFTFMLLSESNINIRGNSIEEILYNSIFDTFRYHKYSCTDRRVLDQHDVLLSPQRCCCVLSSPSFLFHTPVQRSVAATPKWWTAGDEAYTTFPTRCIRTPKNCISRITESGGWDQWLSEKSPLSASLIYLITP